MDKEIEEFGSVVEQFVNGDGSIDSAVDIIGEDAGGASREEVKDALGKMFACIDSAFDLKADIEKRGEVQAFFDSERGGTDSGKAEVAEATAEVLDALNAEEA